MTGLPYPKTMVIRRSFPVGSRSLLVLATSATLLFACAVSIPEPNAQHVAAAKERHPTATAQDLARGRSLYVSKCGNCHALKDPSAYSEEGWDHEVEEMREEQGVKLADSEAQDIVRYLGAASRVAQR